jgi:hypothetical protein
LKRKWHSFYVLIHKSTSYLRFKLYICLIQINNTENSWRDDKCHCFMQYGELLLSHAAVDIFTLYRIIFWITCNIFLFFVCLLLLKKWFFWGVFCCFFFQVTYSTQLKMSRPVWCLEISILFATMSSSMLKVYTWHPSCYSCYKPVDKLWKPTQQYFTTHVEVGRSEKFCFCSGYNVPTV